MRERLRAGGTGLFLLVGIVVAVVLAVIVLVLLHPMAVAASPRTAQVSLNRYDATVSPRTLALPHALGRS